MHDDYWFLGDCIASFLPAGPVFVFVTTWPWHGSTGDWQRCVAVAEAAGATVLVGEWPAEVLHRQGAVQTLLDKGFTHAFMPNPDEVIDRSLLDSVSTAARAFLAQRIYVEMDSYWKRPDCVIRPRENYRPLMLIELANVWPDDVYAFSGRLYGGGRGLEIRSDHGLLHHLGYVGPDERIALKHVRSHRHEMIDRGWWERVWQAWDHNPFVSDLHPAHGPAYGFVERVERPAALEAITDFRAPSASIEPNLPRWPSISVIVTIEGNPKLVRQCLSNLAKCRDLVHEVIAVDSGVADGSLGVVGDFEFVTIVKGQPEDNPGAIFNLGIQAASGEVLVLLSSDALLHRASLVRLIEGLLQSGITAAAGPVTNSPLPGQTINPTYTSLSNLEYFVEDLANTNLLPREVEVLNGFCMALQRPVMDEVGVFDERYGTLPYVSIDYSSRLRQHGFHPKLILNSFVHLDERSSVLEASKVIADQDRYNRLASSANFA